MNQLNALSNRVEYCGPDLNPIEQVFAKIKHLLRKAKQRTITAVWQTIGQLLNAFSPEECKNYFINSGWSRLNS